MTEAKCPKCWGTGLVSQVWGAWCFCTEGQKRKNELQANIGPEAQGRHPVDPRQMALDFTPNGSPSPDSPQ